MKLMTVKGEEVSKQENEKTRERADEPRFPAFSRLMFIVVFIIGLITPGCGARDDGPPRIRYGEETCDRCRMIISEKRFAAAYRTGSGALRKFDDLGCATLHREERQEMTTQFWGYDYEETGWLNAKRAFLVHSPELLTPMGYGIAVLPTPEKAAILAEKVNGQIVQFDQLYSILQP